MFGLPAVPGGVRPGVGARGVAVVDGVPVRVCDLVRVVGLVADRVLVEARLPDAAPERVGHAALEGAPAAGIVRVAFRQGPDRVEVVRQDAEGVRAEGAVAGGGRPGSSPGQATARLMTAISSVSVVRRRSARQTVNANVPPSA